MNNMSAFKCQRYRIFFTYSKSYLLLIRPKIFVNSIFSVAFFVSVFDSCILFKPVTPMFCHCYTLKRSLNRLYMVCTSSFKVEGEFLLVEQLHANLFVYFFVTKGKVSLLYD